MAASITPRGERYRPARHLLPVAVHGEEIVNRQFILDEHPDAIIDIIDATNIERNLYLTLQLMEESTVLWSSRST